MRNAKEMNPVTDTDNELNTVACVRVHSNIIIEYGEPMLKLVGINYIHYHSCININNYCTFRVENQLHTFLYSHK